MDISQDLLRYGKRDNSKPAEAAKIKIRESVLAAIGAEQASVFDAFAGEGAMFKAVWSMAAQYVGCDKDAWYPDDPRMAFAKADNRRVLRAVDLRNYNIFAKRWQANGNKGSRVTYIGLVLEGDDVQ